MKTFISILAVLVIVMAVWKLWEYYERLNQGEPSSAPVSSGSLPSLPPKLEQELAEAKKKGAAGLKMWLDRYQGTGALKDPRLAWIELDYVVLLSQSDPVQARKLFAEVKKRTPPDSPVYPRIKELEKTYE